LDAAGNPVLRIVNAPKGRVIRSVNWTNADLQKPLPWRNHVLV